MQLTGAQIVMECLKEQAVEYIFGYPGGQIMPIYDALYDYTDSITHILTSHEQGATHAADGYSRSTGKVGVCFATSGPGATNAVTGIATAYMDSVPLVVITGQVPLGLIGKDSFQEVDITGITLPITKHNYFIKDIKELADSIREAFKIAKSGRPGPVLIDIPKNLMLEKIDYQKQDIKKIERTVSDCSTESLEQIANLINKADKPVIYAGGGIITSEAAKELTELAEKAHIPVLNSLMGLGSFPREHELSLGMIGMHGSKEANLAMNNSDLILAVGARFSDRVTGNTQKFANKSTIIHIDIDESEISKNIKAKYTLIGDIKCIFRKLIPLVDANERIAWLDEIKNWVRPSISEDEFLPQNIFRTVYEVLGDKTIVTTEVGQHQMWTAQHWPFSKSRSFITSGGLGTMGYGLGAAIGSQLGNPDQTVLHVAGDGSFRMNFNELATVAHNHLPIITLLMKNDTLGMVRQWQTLFFDKRYSSTDLPDVIDYVKLADAFGIEAIHVTNLKELKDAVTHASKKRKPALIINHIHINENVFPIVPPGEAIHNQIFDKKND